MVAGSNPDMVHRRRRKHTLYDHARLLVFYMAGRTVYCTPVFLQYVPFLNVQCTIDCRIVESLIY